MDIKPFINKLFEKGSGWLSSLINATDHSLTKISLFLQEKRKYIEAFIKDRERLIDAIQKAESEIEILNSEINQTSKEQTERLLELYEKLEFRTQELITNQQLLNDLQDSVKSSQQTIADLNHVKDQAVEERNFLRSEYNHLQIIIQENVSKQVELQTKIEDLQKSSENDENIQQQINEHKESIKKLQLEKMKFTHQLSELETELKEKMKQVVQLSGELQQSEEKLREKNNVIAQLQRKMNDNQLEIGKINRETENLKVLIEINNEKKKTRENRIAELNKQVNSLKSKLEEANQLYTEDLIKAQEEIESLTEELIKTQNSLATEKENNATPADITPEALRILEQEYEPRFRTLYPQCHIHKEFYQDFFTLIPSDRLKVEACIVNLNFYYDQHMHKVRPNTVKTSKGTTINEYPFGQGKDNIGRNYFKRDKGEINFYRISRNKNGKGKLDQERVIAWLQNNK